MATSYGQLDGKHRPGARFALQADLATHSPRKVARNRESESHSRKLARCAGVHLKERLEDPVDHVRRNADPGIRHFYLSRVARSECGKLDASVPRSELDRIAEHIE